MITAEPSQRLVTVSPWTLSMRADLYAQGQTLRQIAAQLDLTETTVRDQLRRAGVATCHRSIQRSLVRCEASYHAPVLG
jgi:DNA-binding NarL/FixJ family response regulator